MKKRVIVIITMVLVMGLMISVAYAANPETGTIGSVSYEFSNAISSTKRSANAKTHTSSINAAATANATFYWVDYNAHTFGSSYKHASNYGNAEVYADSTENTAKYYYQVVSYHSASYDGTTVSKTITTFVP